jgi:polysaccharide export outer membrane protein
MPEQSKALARLLSERARGTSPVNYAIVAGDLLTIRVQDMSELSEQFRVSEKGSIVLPLIGRFDVAGLSAEQAAEKLRDRLREYATAPEVTIAVAEFQGARVSVVGAVGSPGVYPLHGFDETITDVLSEAGGLSRDAGTKIYFSPAGESEDVRAGGEAAAGLNLAAAPGMVATSPKAIEIDLTRLYQGRSIPALELPLRGGDTILVPSAGEVYVDGWVNNPGGFSLTRALTVTQAVSNAGGMHFAGSGHGLVLQRASRTGEVETYRVDYQRIVDGSDADLYLQNGDRIRVGANPVKVVPWGVYAVVKGIFSYSVGGSVAAPSINNR